MKSKKQQNFLGSIGFLSKNPTGNERKRIMEIHTNDLDEFEHRNPRLGKRERFHVDKIHKFNNHKFALVGESPTDHKKVSKIIHHE